MDVIVSWKANTSFNYLQNKQYIEYTLAHRVNVLISAMGTGKTKLIFDDIDKYSPIVRKILVVSTRYSYAESITKKLQFANGRDKITII